MKPHSRPGRHLVMGLSGMELTAQERVFLKEQAPIGVIFFSRNIDDLNQLQNLIREILATGPTPPTLWIDQEGGRVQRLREPFTPYPSPFRWAELAKIDFDKALRLSRSAGRLVGLELASLGIGVDCAPVLDIRQSDADPVIGERAFGSDPETVIRLAGAWHEGLSGTGVMGMGKHFPGHGAATSDSHKKLPVVEKSKEALAKWELQPFKALLHRLPALMTAHLVATGLDAKVPATWSRTQLVGLLRESWGYEGLIVTDALEMGALTGTMAERSYRSIVAGCDVVLCCTGRLADSEATLDGITQAMGDPQSGWDRASPERVKRVLSPHRIAPGKPDRLLADGEYLKARKEIEALGEDLSQVDPTEQLHV
ncbi:MAG: beta-N-acetylhexosaminidase [Magnetococcales bacterium]|nr:beta-N-acetylhexosaminidase [Magnetococcales bacterium]